jgi:hypothetical protein
MCGNFYQVKNCWAVFKPDINWAVSDFSGHAISLSLMHVVLMNAEILFRTV